MNAQKISFLINECIDGVERSNVGGFFIKDDKGNLVRDQFGSPCCTLAGFHTFQTVLSTVLYAEVLSDF